MESARDNIKDLWNAIKKVTGSNKSIDHSPQLLNPSNGQESVNSVNSFFTNIGKNLAERIPQSNKHYSFPKIDCSPQFSLVMSLTDEDEVFNLIMKLKNKCAVGIDLISSKITKRYAALLTSPLCHIINLSISHGVFPSVFKVALVKPIHKSGSKDRVDNYRPISLLPTFSKITERVMNDRLIKFLEGKNLLSPAQYGFRRARSTNDAVHELVNSAITSLDSKRKCLAVFLDLAKAFDTVSIPLLLNKLQSIGVRGTPLKLLTDYLQNRTQRVRIDEWSSTGMDIIYGVPQGSILGPTLFLVYINELCNLPLHNGTIFTFADDTALFFSGESWHDVFLSAQRGLNVVGEWLRHNILTLNIDKTKYVTFAFRVDLLPSDDQMLYVHSCTNADQCSCPSLTRTKEIKYLGVVIDQTLSFKPHIDTLVVR